jgi:signal transduction histidine kinase
VRAQLPCWLQGDRTQLTRVLADLLGNAIKYSPAGTEVSVDAVDDQVEAMSRDQGTGIPADELDQFFEPRVRAQSSLPGHGLGLAIAQSLVREHGDTISASNHSSGGAVLRLRFPRALRLTEQGV